MINNNGELALDCGFLSTLSCSLIPYSDIATIRPCCFMESYNLSINEFFNKTFNDLGNLRPYNKEVINCKFICDLKKVDTLEINFLYKCNINCIHCISGAPNNKESLTKTKGYILKIFEKIINEKYHFKKIHLDGSGEIFIIYEDLKNYLKLLSRENVEEIMFATNATLVTKNIVEELYQISNETGVKYSFDISLDGITKKTFENTRKGAIFENVIENIKNIQKYFEFMLSFTAKETNLEDDPQEVVAFFKNLGAIYPTIRYDALDEKIKEEYLKKYRNLLSC